MPIVVKTVGILICCIGAINIFGPAMMRSAIAFFREGKRLYAAAAIRVALGILLIFASFSCSVTEVVLAIGIIALLSGGVAIGLGLSRMQAFVGWWLAKPDTVLRAMAGLSILFGAALIYAA